ncbi:hypothetical protein CONPUDRAFT_58547 [Coniophora puteana RWD-64-598 SS2]|uniref:Uncharacterized protein n=1 Tax=Coniophora puteana (strain RWD-64-598) TaxID=741705 RepID=A0A5M3MLA0_CONPW|nr:uncharacterized protein CONPUDRAFT_58547 [Coniophora puteana RWD-64-598 SS2]EIW80009.1 hypothetical protein CONPUDRAFT_58547 [Coniophora puteana RWD-64-598 SS2]
MTTSQVTVESATLAGTCLESFVYGIFFALFFPSIYVLVKREQDNRSRTHSKRSATYPLIITSVLLFVFITAHWICTFIRLFQAYITEDASKAPSFLADLLVPAVIIINGMLIASMITADSMVIYRLWIVWNKNRTVMVFPCCTLVGLCVSGAGYLYQIAQKDSSYNIYSPVVDRWINSTCIFTLVWPTVAILVESAMIYTSWVIVYFGVYQAGSNVETPIVLSMPEIAGIACMLISVRVGLGWANDGLKSQKRNPLPSSHGQQMRDCAVHKTAVVRDVGEYELPWVVKPAS